MGQEASKATGNFWKFQPIHLQGSAATDGLHKQRCQYVHMHVQTSNANGNAL